MDIQWDMVSQGNKVDTPSVDILEDMASLDNKMDRVFEDILRDSSILDSKGDTDSVDIPVDMAFQGNKVGKVWLKDIRCPVRRGSWERHFQEPDILEGNRLLEYRWGKWLASSSYGGLEVRLPRPAGTPRQEP